VAGTYDLLSSYTVTSGSGDATITLSGISGSYDDLSLFVEGYSTSAGNSKLGLNFNSSTNTSWTQMLWKCSGATTFGAVSENMWSTSGTTSLDECSWGNISRESNYWFGFQFYINGYSNTSMPTEVVVSGLSLPTSSSQCCSGWGGYQWGETTAVTEINLKVHDSAAEFAQNSSVRLYGIKHTV
tara:strand:- start:958 stop:1509 length:552 start_codon:yes stop_codon:yes gene_type:complete